MSVDIVTKLYVENQTDLGPCVLSYTSLDGGDYRISVVVSINSFDNEGSFHATLDWGTIYGPGEIQSESLDYNARHLSPTTGAGVLVFSGSVHMKANGSLGLALAGDSVPEGSTVSAYFTLEKLNLLN